MSIKSSGRAGGDEGGDATNSCSIFRMLY